MIFVPVEVMKGYLEWKEYKNLGSQGKYGSCFFRLAPLFWVALRLEKDLKSL